LLEVKIQILENYAMSKESQVTLPDPAVAYNQLFDGVHAQVFLGKLASYGIQPTTEKEAADLFMLAGRLRHVDGPEKQAATQSRFGGAVSALDSVLGNTPEGRQQFAANGQRAIKQAAAELMQDPSVYNAVLSLKAYEAAVLAGEQ
jgi:hypothetical protein